MAKLNANVNLSVRKFKYICHVLGLDMENVGDILLKKECRAFKEGYKYGKIAGKLYERGCLKENGKRNEDKDIAGRNFESFCPTEIKVGRLAQDIGFAVHVDKGKRVSFD